MTGKERERFINTVLDNYAAHGRHDLPWRVPEPDGSFDPYKILVSELMLQQTQVSRVIPKYHEFLARFPTLADLAGAPLGEVLTVWSGLGYNRRAKFLWQAAQTLTKDFGGKFPRIVAELSTLPGVGKNTAGAILAYAFNQPVVFIETNIRTVYIHHFFQDQTSSRQHIEGEKLRFGAHVPLSTLRSDAHISSHTAQSGEGLQAISDKVIVPLIENTLDAANPRAWYWALMDYGAHLKQTIGNLNKLSIHYVKQSRFEGSRRQVRGQVIRLLSGGSMGLSELEHAIPDPRLGDVLGDLLREQLIRRQNAEYSLA